MCDQGVMDCVIRESWTVWSGSHGRCGQGVMDGVIRESWWHLLQRHVYPAGQRGISHRGAGTVRVRCCPGRPQTVS